MFTFQPEDSDAWEQEKFSVGFWIYKFTAFL